MQIEHHRENEITKKSSTLRTEFQEKEQDMSRIQIRRAEIKDIPRMLDLLVQVCMVHHRGRPDLFNGPATKYSEEELKEILQDPGRPIFAAVDENDTMQGYAFCIAEQILGDAVRTDVKTLYIDDICVEETARGRHIGRRLYDHVVAWAREEGFYNVTLNVWSCNPGAMKFYESCGMQPQKVGMEMIL